MRKQDKSGSSPSVKHPINSKGLPILKVNVPGYNKNEGTPGWVKAAANAATSKVDKGTGNEHRSTGHQSGNQPRGKSPEQIRGGQAGG